MTVKKLINWLQDFDPDKEVIIGMVQNYGSDFAMGISDVAECEVRPWRGDNMECVVITEGSQFGVVNYED